jgi:amphi-Trp domain-containing protein
MASDKEFHHESIQDKDTIIRYLNTFGDGFQKGEIEFRAGADEIVIKPEGLIQMEIKAKRTGRKSKMTIKFSWKETPSGHGKTKLQISPAD